MLAAAYWAASAQGGVTRQGVVLTYLLSFVVGSQENLSSSSSSSSFQVGRVYSYIHDLVTINSTPRC